MLPIKRAYRKYCIDIGSRIFLEYFKSIEIDYRKSCLQI
jgi:hypothetical protein